eukprot:gene4743-5194_t
MRSLRHSVASTLTRRSPSLGRWTSSKTDFGYQEVDRNAKERLVRDVFSSVATKYDIMNDLMSMGVHRLWKDEFVSMMGLTASANVESQHVPRVLDVAGGTGDIAFRIAQTLASTKYASKLNDSLANGAYDQVENRPIVVCDINPEMLAVGKERAIPMLGAKQSKLVGFVEGNAERLPFADNTFDLYTIAFGLRNVTNKEVALGEAYRVLRPGGRLMILEFSEVRQPLLRMAYDQFSFHIIPRIGEVVAQDRSSYQYLVESIRRFPKQDELLGMVRQAGFRCASYVNFTLGVCAVHSGYKLEDSPNVKAAEEVKAEPKV